LDDIDRVKQYVKARRKELFIMGMNQKNRNKKRGLSMSEDIFAGQLGMINREIKRIQKVLKITDSEVFDLE